MFRKRGKQQLYHDAQRIAAGLDDMALKGNGYNIIIGRIQSRADIDLGLTLADIRQAAAKALRTERGKRRRKQ